MTDTQLFVAIGVPMLFNALIATILIAYINAKNEGLRNEILALSQRFDDLRDL
jgi:ABC-type glycerol-3-phosphate transport system permease component